LRCEAGLKTQTEQAMPEASYILHIGGVFNEETLLRNSVISPAALRWQMGLLRGICEAGTPVVVVSHEFHRPFPWGPLHASGRTGEVLQAPFEHHVLGYLNLPAARDIHLQLAYRAGVEEVVRRRGRPLCVTTYNASPLHVWLGRMLATRYGVPWICLVADLVGPSEHLNGEDYAVVGVAGAVFLSWHSFQNSSMSPRLHLDGGVEMPRFAPDLPESYLPPRATMVFYSGSVVMEFGVSTLLEAFRLLRDSQIRLIMCGKGSGHALMRAVRRDPRVSLVGCVSDAQLTDLGRQASVMVNPRPNLIDHRHNFPSKLLEYLSYGKPVVSTWTPGLHPSYREFVTVPENDAPAALADAIRYVLTWNVERRSAHAERTARFLRQEKLWSIQAQRFLMWLAVNVLRRP
jgi:glycosyltransferase involved in cell wall biosynthesis